MDYLNSFGQQLGYQFGVPFSYLVIAVVLIIAGLIGWSIYRKWEDDKVEAGLADLEKRRERDYRDARKAYREARKALSKDNTIVIDIIHDLGDDFYEREEARPQIDFDEAFEAVAQIRDAHKRSHVVVVLHTLGGYSRPAHMIASAIKERNKNSVLGKGNRTIVYVPYLALSGGTIIALAADKIVMGTNAELGPIDPIMGGFQASALRDLRKLKSPDAIGDFTMLLSIEAEKYWEYAKKVARELTNEIHRKRGDDPNSVPDELIEGRTSHSHTLLPAEAKDLGLNVTTDCPREVFELVDARIRMINTKIEHEQRRIERQLGIPADDLDEEKKSTQKAVMRYKNLTRLTDGFETDNRY